MGVLCTGYGNCVLIQSVLMIHWTGDGWLPQAFRSQPHSSLLICLSPEVAGQWGGYSHLPSDSPIPPPKDVLEERRKGGGGVGTRPWWGGGGGGLGPKCLCTKVTRQDFPNGKGRFFPRGSLWSGGGGGPPVVASRSNRSLPPPLHPRTLYGCCSPCSWGMTLVDKVSLPGVFSARFGLTA